MTDPCDVNIEVENLRTLDLDGLRLRWRTEFARTAPAKLTKSLLRSLLAYRLQARIAGDLSRETRRLLDMLNRQEIGGGGKAASVPLPGGHSLKRGTILVREHEGHRHHVVVSEHGYDWNGETYASLSKVAFAITGTKWSGPRFFGLRETNP